MTETLVVTILDSYKRSNQYQFIKTCINRLLTIYQSALKVNQNSMTTFKLCL